VVAFLGEALGLAFDLEGLDFDFEGLDLDLEGEAFVVLFFLVWFFS